MPQVEVDYLSHANAEALAQVVRNYWSARGFTPHVRVEYQSGKVGGLWVVRSDMQRGLPAGCTQDHVSVLGKEFYQPNGSARTATRSPPG